MMRPRMLWLTSTLSTLSTLISKVRRLMKPVLWTIRKLVTSVSVVQRWNHAATVQYNAASATRPDPTRHKSTSPSVVVERDRKNRTAARTHAAIAGKKNIQCALVEY